MIEFRATLLVLLALAPAQSADDGLRAPRFLRTELQEEPLAIDTVKPRFSWEVDDPRRGAAQTKWRVLVGGNATLAQREKGEEWDSGEVAGARTCGVEYAGKPLLVGRTYWWVVRTWDAQGNPSPWSAPAKFTFGPIASSDWRAQWIRAGRAPRGDEIGHHSGWLKAEDDYPYVQLDFGGDVRCDALRLHPARPHGDLAKPGELFPLRVRVYTDPRAQFADKAMRIAQYDWRDVPDAGAAPLDLPLGAHMESAPEGTRPSAHTLRYIRIVVTKLPKAEQGYAFALGEVEVLDGGTNIAQRAQITVGSALDDPRWSPAALNDGKLVPPKEGDAPGQVAAAPDALPRLRGAFTLDHEIARATLHVSALGLYHLSVNGTPLDDQRLVPGWTDYGKRVAYQTYEIAPLLTRGENILGVQLAPGWYAGRIGLADQGGEGRTRGFYGEEPQFIAQCDVVLENGRRVAVQTDATWRWSRSGPLLAADLLDGEHQDLRRETPGWDFARYQGTEWRPVEVVAPPGPERFAQRADPVRVWHTRPAVSVREVAPKTHLYDFGQNLAGVVRLAVQDRAGTEVVVRHAEAVDEKGRLYTANLRGAAQTDRYVLRGGPRELLEPRFTVHGFRYAEVSGLTEPIPLDDVTALAIGNDLREVGTFECSDPLLNQIWKNAGWSLRSNLVAIPTDCPQRDERLGWMGDVQIVAPTMLDRYDAAGLLTQWLADVRGAQTKDGRFPDFAPHPFDPEKRFAGAPGWGDAGVLVPWEVWLRTADRRLLAASVEPALRWIRFIATKNPSLVWSKERGKDYGDWLNGSTIQAEGWACEGCEVPKELFATAFFARSAQVTAWMAEAAGNAAAASEASQLAVRVRKAFREAFGKADGQLVGDCQAAYALALDFDLDTDATSTQPSLVQLWADRLAARIRAQGKLTCGIQTATRALNALSLNGHHDLALELARRRTLPSWGYMIDQGATTMWERWDAFVTKRGFQDPGMNSLNHFAFGAIGEWLMQRVAGLGPARGGRPDPKDGPVFRFQLRPQVTGGLAWARAEYRSILGSVKCAWNLEGKELTYDCTLPPGARASLRLPTDDILSLSESGKAATPASWPGVQRLRSDPGWVNFELEAGSYTFTCTVK